MFLTKKSILKILVITICYFLLGSICGIAYRCLQIIGISVPFLNVLSLIVYGMCVLIILVGGYGEGKGNLINLGNKLVLKELRPADFINHYISLKNANDLMVASPSAEVLQLVVLAYNALEDRENALATIDEMIAVAKNKKKPFAKLLKASLLYDYGETEEAEALFFEAKEQKLDMLGKYLADAILKSDRAMALGDYMVAETFFLETLAHTHPKRDKLARLATNKSLGDLYLELQDNEKAIMHYQYCVVNGGETAIRKNSAKKLEELKRQQTAAIEE